MNKTNILATEIKAANIPTIVQFQNLNSKLYLWASGNAGSPAAQNTLSQHDSFNWILEYNESDDTFVIRPKNLPNCHLVSDNGNQGWPIKIWSSANPTKWKLEYDEENDAHRIVCEHGNFIKGAAVKDASMATAAQIILWDKTIAGTNDRWLVTFL